MRIIGQCEHGTKSTGGQEDIIQTTDDIMRMRIIGQCEHGTKSTGGQEDIIQTTLCASLANVNMAQRALVVKKTALHRRHYAYHWPM